MAKVTKKPVKKPRLKKDQFRNGNPIDPGFSLKAFDLDPEVAKELEEQGLEARYVNIKLMGRNGGTHPRGWRPYKRQKSESSTRDEYLFGKDPEGYVRRGDLVLAVKTKEEVSKHRAYLDYEAKSHSVNRIIKNKRKEMREMIKNQGMGDYVTLHEGYEENN